MIDIEEFKEISRSVLAKIIDNFELITCIRGKVIVEERQKFDYIYFIREGEFEISKLINMTVSTQQVSPHKIMELAREGPEPGKITKQNRTMISKQHVSVKNHVLGILGCGNNVGLIEAYYKI